MARHFISYSRRRDAAIAVQVYEAILCFRPDLAPWIDRHDLAAWQPYGTQIQQAIAECEAVLFFWSQDSQVSDDCQGELQIARYYGRPILALKVDPGVEIMYEIASRSPVDLTGELHSGLQELFRQLEFLHSPAGLLVELQRQRERCRRDLLLPDSRPDDIAREMRQIEQAIAELKPLAHDPAAARERARERIERERDRERAAVPVDLAWSSLHQVTRLPELPPDPAQFHDRTVQTERLDELIRDDAVRAVVVTGPAGLGKTAMVTRFARRLGESAQPVPVDAVIYQSAHGIRPVSPAHLLEDLGGLVPADGTADQDQWRRRTAVTEKLEALLPELDGIRVLVIVDSFEELLEPDTGEVRDPGLHGLLAKLLDPQDHGVKLLLVGREPPGRLLRDRVDDAIRMLPLDVGLPPADARRVLERLDVDNSLGLASMAPEELARICARTGGHPRALEALAAILRHNRRASVRELLDQTSRLPREAIVNRLIIEMFNQLYHHERQVAQALALYGRPVSAAAVDHLLQPYLPGEQSKRVLERLVDMRLVRRDGPTDYYLPTPDRDLLLKRIPLGAPGDEAGTPRRFTRMALWPHAADWFKDLARTEPRNLEELRPQLAEIALRIAGRQVERAFDLIHEVDNTWLQDWGWSGLLVGHRQALVGLLADPIDEVINLNDLARAETQLGDLPGAIAHYRSAVDVAQQHGLLSMVPGLRVNLGSAQYDLGQGREARRSFGQAMLGAEEYLSSEDQSLAITGLALCDAEAGDLQLAIDQGERALEIVRRCSLHAEERRLLLNSGRWFGQLGKEAEALRRLEDALELASEHGERARESRCLGAIAEVLVDQGRLGQAIKRAEAAMTIGEQVRRPELVAEAATTLALARLRGAVDAVGLDQAWSSIEVACDHRRPRETLLALVVAAVIALRRGDPQAAEDAVDELAGEVDGLLAEGEPRFEPFDALGVALCVTAVTGEDTDGAVTQAAGAFQAARALTAAPGVVDRVLRLLDDLDEAVPPGLLAEARRAAAG